MLTNRHNFSLVIIFILEENYLPSHLSPIKLENDEGLQICIFYVTSRDTGLGHLYIYHSRSLSLHIHHSLYRCHVILELIKEPLNIHSTFGQFHKKS